MTKLPLSPFINPALPLSPTAPTSFLLDERLFWYAVDPTFSWEFDDTPLFISDPSPDFVKACQRDLLPLLEDLARSA